MAKKHPSNRVEELAKEQRRARKRVVLMLFVAGMTSRSLTAIRSIKRICQEQFGKDYDLSVVDLYRRPALARAEQIIAVPTLLKKFPLPLRRMIGDLQNESRVLTGLDLKKRHEAPRL